MRKKIVRFLNKICKKTVNFFFDEDEKDLVESYKNLGILAVISFVISIFAIVF